MDPCLPHFQYECACVCAFNENKKQYILQTERNNVPYGLLLLLMVCAAKVKCVPHV